MIQEPAPAVAGKRDELGMQFFVVDASFGHMAVLSHRTADSTILLLQGNTDTFADEALSNAIVFSGKVSVPPAVVQGDRGQGRGLA